MGTIWARYNIQFASHWPRDIILRRDGEPIITGSLEIAPVSLDPSLLLRILRQTMTWS